MPFPLRSPLHSTPFSVASASDFIVPPPGLIERLDSLSSASALLLIWERETHLFERAWLHRLCASGETESALSWLCQDEALFEIFGLCPVNAPGRVWDRMARASGLRLVCGGQSREADERCQRLAAVAGVRQLFPPERRERLRRALWRQAKDDLRSQRSPLADLCSERLLPWPPPPESLEIWLAACQTRADESRSSLDLSRALLVQETLERAGFSPRAL